MNPEEASQVLKSMITFIRSHGDERVANINKQAEDEFTIQKEKYIAEEKERLTQEYKNRLQQDEIKLRIQKSAEQNAQRIQKMKTVNTLVEKIYKEAKHKMVSKQKGDAAAYKELLKNLIVQGLIKFMEPEVNVRCRKTDYDVVKTIVEAAATDYKKLMKEQVKAFANREVPCKVNLDEGRHLPEYDETEGAESCMGGIVLHCKKGRIVCSNTLDDRLQLVYQESVPEVRRILFPSFKKPVQKAAAPVKTHGH